MRFNEMTKSSHKCPHCGGPMFSEMLMMEKKDACYYKVKASAKVWPSAYASGRLVQCRKKGAANYGNKSEGVAEAANPAQQAAIAIAKKKKAGMAENIRVEPVARSLKTQSTQTQPKQNVYVAPDKKTPAVVNHIKQKGVAEGSLEEIDRRGFLQGLGAAALGAAGLGASGAAQARATPEWMEKVAQAKELFNKGLSPEQVAKKLGVSGPNNGMAGPMGGDWGAINYAYREVQRSRGTGTNEDYNPEYDDEAGMADNNLETLRRAVDGIDDVINTGDNLPEWCQEKIAVAKSMLVSVWDYMRSEQDRGANPELAEEFDLIESCIDRIADHNGVDAEMIWEDLESLSHDELYVFAVTSEPIMEDWQKANKSDRTAGMSQKAVNAYRRENPGSKLQTAVTTKPSKLKKGSKSSKRRKSYCSRSRGQMKMHNISCAKTPDKAICKARRRWNC